MEHSFPAFLFKEGQKKNKLKRKDQSGNESREKNEERERIKHSSIIAISIAICRDLSHALILESHSPAPSLVYAEDITLVEITDGIIVIVSTVSVALLDGGWAITQSGGGQEEKG